MVVRRKERCCSRGGIYGAAEADIDEDVGQNRNRTRRCRIRRVKDASADLKRVRILVWPHYRHPEAR